MFLSMWWPSAWGSIGVRCGAGNAYIADKAGSACGRGAHLMCLNETGFLLMPALPRTWAPSGATPTVSVRTRSHEKVSGIGALIVSPRRRQIALALALHPRVNIRGPQVLRFLRHLARHV